MVSPVRHSPHLVQSCLHQKESLAGILSFSRIEARILSHLYMAIPEDWEPTAMGSEHHHWTPALAPDVENVIKHNYGRSQWEQSSPDLPYPIHHTRLRILTHGFLHKQNSRTRLLMWEAPHCGAWRFQGRGQKSSLLKRLLVVMVIQLDTAIASFAQIHVVMPLGIGLGG